MRSLRRSHGEFLEAGLDDGGRARDLVPGHGYPEPLVEAPPPADPDQEVRPSFSQQFRVEPRDLQGHVAASRAVEAMDVDDNDVHDVVEGAVPQHTVAFT